MDARQIESIVEEVLNELNLKGKTGSSVGAPANAAERPRASSSPATSLPSQSTGARIHDYLGEFPAVISARRKSTSVSDGVFETVDEAVNAAEDAFNELSSMTLEQRGQLIDAIRACGLKNKKDFAERTVAETGMGRVDHKIKKFEMVAAKTPGIEILRPECFTGDHGLTVDELAPYGVIGAVTPVTHPLPTMAWNSSTNSPT